MTDDLRGFDADARRAVAVAEIEARGLHHERVGTEHLLIGVLALDGTAASALLHDAGITLTSTRHKVAEAVPQGTVPDDLPQSERAARALGRSHRFCHASRAAAVGPEHVLLGVLDVEGTAGQVLRGLGADVDRLRAALKALPGDGAPTVEAGEVREANDAVEPVEPVEADAPAAALRCPGCAAVLDDAIEYRVLIATGPRGPREVVAYSCRACGCVLGAAPT